MGSWSGYFRVVICLIFCLICSGTDTFQLTLVYSSSLCLQEEADCFGTAHVPSNMQRSPTCQDLDATQPRMPRTSRMARAWRAAVRCLRCPQPRGAESISRPPRREQLTADRRPQVTTAKPKSTHTTHTTTPRKPLAENQIDRQHEELWCLGVAPTALNTMDAT
jgi:hypothetical protein